jgi:hypothetical protein
VVEAVPLIRDCEDRDVLEDDDPVVSRTIEPADKPDPPNDAELREAADDPESTTLDDLGDLAVVEAVPLIRDCEDRDVLTRWLEAEMRRDWPRKTIIEPIEAKLGEDT